MFHNHNKETERKYKMKTCTKCKKDKDILYFYKNNNFKDGYNSSCKSCDSAINKEYQKIYKFKRTGICKYCQNFIFGQKVICAKCKENKKNIDKKFICKVCNKEYTFGKQKNNTLSLCSRCHIYKFRVKRRTKCINIKGGACEICGYNECIDALAFHHKKPDDKLFKINAINCGGKKWEKILKELEKCTLLCHNCHTETHVNERKKTQKFGNKNAKWRAKIKKTCIELAGGACNECGYNKCQESLVFHHIDRNRKKFGIAGTSFATKKIVKETKKCILLCQNCHAEIHAEINKNKRLS